MKFNKDIAKTTVKKSLSLPNEEKEVSPLYRHYFDLKTGEPIPLDRITKRIKKRFHEIDKLSVNAMLDLYFVHQNWSTFYDRQDSFQNYLKEEVQISKSHAYGILHGVSLLEEYFSQQKGDVLSFLEEVTSSLEKVGIRKLREISSIKDTETKHSLLTKLLSGEDLSTQQILQEKQKQKEEKKESDVYYEGPAVYYKSDRILTVEIDDPALTSHICKAVKKFFE
ncbi:MAG: hypothetical protein K9L68_13370 [Spirochaetales bacterium]|nr:hypothetical protein [Spirochaetales bacterium]